VTINKRLRQFEDLAGGEAGNMEQLINTFVRVKGSGRLNIREIEPLLGMGFDPLTQLKEMYGGSKQHWHKELEDPTQGFMLFTKALDHATGPGGMFYKMQENLMNTTAFGKKILFETNMEAAKAELGKNKYITDAEMRLFDTLNGMVEKVDTDGLARGLGGAINGFTDLLPSMRDFGSGLADVLKPVGKVVFSDEVKGFVKTLFDLGQNIAYDIAPQVKKLGDAATWAIDHMGKEANWYQSGYDLMQRLRLGNRKEENTGSGLMNVFGNVGSVKHDLSVLTGGWIKDDAGISLNGKDPKTWSKLFKYNGSWEGSGYDAGFGGRMPFGVKPEKKGNKELSDAVNETGDAIIGGGRKQININYNAPLYKVEHQVFQSVKDAINDFEPRVKEALLRIFNSIPGYF